MKKILLAVFLGTLAAFSAKAQIFSQNFNSSSLISDYVNASGETNKFTSISGGTNNPVSISAGTLRFAKSGGNSAYFSRNVNFSPNAPGALKIQFSMQVESNTVAGTTQMQLYVGNGYSNSASTVPGNSNSHSKLVFNFGGANDFSISSSTAPTAPTALYNTKQTLTWIINNSGTAISYTAPDGTTTKTLANDKWDLYIGNASTPVLADRDGISNSTPGDGKDNPLQNIYFSYPSASENATVEIDDIVIDDPNATLPVNLTGFTAKANDQQVDLNWKTASETNNARFEILRSGDGKTFNEIDKIPGRGTSTTEQTYTFIDKAPLFGVNYYQLKQVDYNGATNRSKIVSVKSNVSASNIKIFSSGGQTNISIGVADNSHGKLSVYEITGKKILEKFLTLTKGYQIITLPLQHAGVYLFTLVNKNETITKRFVK